MSRIIQHTVNLFRSLGLTDEEIESLFRQAKSQPTPDWYNREIERLQNTLNKEKTDGQRSDHH
jgi:hypothetical protein